MGEVIVEPTYPPAIAPVAQPRIVVDRTQSANTAEPPEVHVHIGRIEVTAVEETAPPKKSRTAQPRTLPLGDYLARRRQS